MNGSFSEIYVIECETLAIVEANAAAGASLQHDPADLLGMSYSDLAPGLSTFAWKTMVAPLCNGEVDHIRFDTTQMRKDGSCYPIEFRLFRIDDEVRPVFIAIGNDLSLRHESAKALRAGESRFRAIVSNTPGLVYQFRLQGDQEVSFPYLSEGCHALLGISVEQLHADSSLFLQLILSEDRQSYLDAMSASALEMKGWNWEGRIWIEAWKDIK